MCNCNSVTQVLLKLRLMRYSFLLLLFVGVQAQPGPQGGKAMDPLKRLAALASESSKLESKDG